jgi:hypothetical protein
VHGRSTRSLDSMDAVQRLKARDQLRAVEIELRRWDPLGTIANAKGPFAPLDEYDSLAPNILRCLQAGGSIDELAKQMNDLVTNRLGVPGGIDHDRLFAEQLIQWWKAREG